MKSKNYDSILIDHLQKAYSIAPKRYKKRLGSIIMLYTFPSLNKRLKARIIIYYIFKALGFIALSALVGFGLMLLLGLVVL